MEERIRQLRKTLNLTQQEFAEKINLSPNYVYMIEKGSREASDRTISDICRIFNVNIEWLRSGNGGMFIQMDREDQIMEWAGTVLREESVSFRKRFVAMLSKLSEKDWEVLEKMALSLAEEKEISDDQ